RIQGFNRATGRVKPMYWSSYTAGVDEHERRVMAFLCDFISANSGLSLLLFSQSLVIQHHEEVIQRLSQRGMGKDAVANNSLRQLPHHGDLQYRHHFPAFHAKD